ncbi:unnamed protein product [Prorocentrum cordatum]|uniref:Glucosyltransferase 24 catalytic domain-containing protein n=1 Tax=Prorocentrum cordatum TaxID=2364126 RepID=A0ABN9UPX9_9DINO|nr:unnamed protein product [Polarella glacialis]
MITSVREHTKCPLRLWLVENFLSPSFRRVLPAVAKEVGFAVSQVTYKWPEWLRAQTQKQRVIWAYKILFLDVFFPSQVKRVMFIDADQIVRADVKEVYDTNMDGHVYGFVPFCGSGPKTSSLLGWSQEDLRNPDTNGFRFWEQGYWSNHLGPDRYYHISALFVVDLELFRQRGAGDILRGTYQSLTADPNSLANLDQDLPNFVQGQLPIFTLPQDSASPGRRRARCRGRASGARPGRRPTLGASAVQRSTGVALVRDVVQRGLEGAGEDDRHVPEPAQEGGQDRGGPTHRSRVGHLRQADRGRPAEDERERVSSEGRPGHQRGRRRRRADGRQPTDSAAQGRAEQ